MFDKLEDLVKRIEEVRNSLLQSEVISNPTKLAKLMKEEFDLSPIVEKYKS